MTGADGDGRAEKEGQARKALLLAARNVQGKPALALSLAQGAVVLLRRLAGKAQDYERN